MSAVTLCDLVFENTWLFDLAKSIFGKIRRSKSDQKMAARKRLLFLMMVKKILSEKTRKREKRRRFFINKYLQSRKVFGNASILLLTLPQPCRIWQLERQER